MNSLKFTVHVGFQHVFLVYWRYCTVRMNILTHEHCNIYTILRVRFQDFPLRIMAILYSIISTF